VAAWAAAAVKSVLGGCIDTTAENTISIQYTCTKSYPAGTLKDQTYQGSSSPRALKFFLVP